MAGTASPDTADESFPERMSSMASDLGIVSLHLVLPDDLRERLPSVSEQLGNFGAAGEAGRARRPARPSTAAARERGRPAPAAPRHRARADRADPGGQGGRAGTARRSPGSSTRSSPTRAPASRRCTSCTSCSPTTRGTTFPSGRTYGESQPPIPGLRDNVWNSDGEAVNQGWQRHLLQVAYVDRQLGVLMTKLRATGLWDRALIVLAADHGVAFAPSSPRRKITRQDVRRDRTGAVLHEAAARDPRPHHRQARARRSTSCPPSPTRSTSRCPRSPTGSRRSPTTSARSPTCACGRRRRPGSSSRLEVPYSEYLARRRAWSTSRPRCSAPGRLRPGLLWAVGPNRELVGRPWPQPRSPVRCPRPCATTVPRSSRPGRPPPPWAPSHVSGEIDGLPARPQPGPRVNGRIRAVGRTYDYLGKTRFSFMAPEFGFRAGANDARVLAVTGSGPGVRLSALGG